jgi:restriction system protein
MSRRRKRAANGSGDGGAIDALFEIARLSPALGLGVAAVTFAAGAFLFWGDAKRWQGLAPMAGMPLLLLAVLVAAASLIFYFRDRVLRTTTDRTDAHRHAAPSPTPARHPLGGRTEGGFPAPPPRDGRAFERLVAAHFRTQGYAVKATGTHGTGGDRGIDLLLRRPDAPTAPTICVQCKDYAQWKVGAPAVREFASAVRLRGPGHVGWIVTTGRFTADAARDAAQLDLRLIDGTAWTSMQAAAGLIESPSSTPSPTGPPADVPLCPACRIPMVRRDPKPQGKAFRPFWGCSNFPRCRQTVDIA